MMQIETKQTLTQIDSSMDSPVLTAALVRAKTKPPDSIEDTFRTVLLIQHNMITRGHARTRCHLFTHDALLTGLSVSTAGLGQLDIAARRAPISCSIGRGRE